MEPSSYLSELSLRKNPRPGQLKVFKYLEENDIKKLNIKLPTGYGKTFTSLVCYNIAKNKLGCNRLLIVFPTKAQINQFRNDATSNLREAGLCEPFRVVDIRETTLSELMRLSLKNMSYVYLTTIQALIAKVDIINTLMQKGRWFLCVDEYHHYGVEKSWGLTVNSLNYDFLLAMSATPYRQEDDSAFGPPDVEVTYRDGVKEGALKRLTAHSYIYKIDTINGEGDVVSYTTSEIAEEAGNTPESIEKWKITRKVRWSPKYVSPLVSIPIERMIRMSLETGRPLQATVGCFCVSHAEIVCEQIKSLFPELKVDWVGTGENGRPDEVNDKIIKEFCPPKDQDGNRNPSIRVLVHVGMAGEGLDSPYITETVHLHQCNITNTENQENGRTARMLLNLNGDDIEANINFDSTSEYALKGYIGEAIMDAMDCNPPQKGEGDTREPEYKPIPEEPAIDIFDVSLLKIDSGTEGVRRMAEVLNKECRPGMIDLAELLKDKNHPGWETVVSSYRTMRHIEAEQHNEKAIVAQWGASVEGALSAVAGLVIKKITAGNAVFEKSMPGDIRRKINSRKSRIIGRVSKDVEVYKRHYMWIKSLETEILDEGVPSWLM